MQLKELLQQMIDAKASDVFIIAGLPLSYQKSGIHVRTMTTISASLFQASAASVRTSSASAALSARSSA